MRVEEDLHEEGRRPGHEVEGEVPSVPEDVLDVVAEDVEVEHVPDDVEPAAVKEHRGEDGQDLRRVVRDMLEEPVGDDRPGVDEIRELLPEGDLVEEDKDVRGDQEIVDDRNARGRDRVLQRDYGPGSLGL